MSINQRMAWPWRAGAGAVFAALLMVLAPVAAGAETALTVYGNSYAERIFGPFEATVACLSSALSVPMETTRLPLSRSRQVMTASTPALWYPSSFRKTGEAAARLIGPVTRVPVYWYQRRGDTRDVTSAAFRDTATVATPRGSRTARMLKLRGYRVTWAALKPELSVSALLEGAYDALLGSDYAQVLSKRAMKRVQRRLFTRLPVAFEANEALADQRPDLLADLKQAIGRCRADATRGTQ